MDTYSAKKLYRTLVNHGIEPDEEYTAVAGKDHGHVSVYNLYVFDRLVVWSNNAVTHCEIVDAGEVGELSDWLVEDGLAGVDHLVNVANVLGVGAVDAADADDDGPFIVLETRYLYGPTETTSVAEDDGRQVQFDTYAEASAWIASQEDGDYCTMPHERRRPSRVIVSL